MPVDPDLANGVHVWGTLLRTDLIWIIVTLFYSKMTLTWGFPVNWKMTCQTVEVMQYYPNSLSMYAGFFDRMAQGYYTTPLLHLENDFLDLGKSCKQIT